MKTKIPRSFFFLTIIILSYSVVQCTPLVSMVCDGISHTQLKSALWMDVTKSDIVIITGGSKVQTIFCDRRSVPITANSVSSRCGTGSPLCTGRIPTFFRDVILLFFICSSCFLEKRGILKAVCKNKLNASNLQFIFNFLSSIWITNT